MLEVEHASVAEVFISNDVERGLWDVGASWEWLLDQLGAFLRGEAPGATDETAAEEAAFTRHWPTPRPPMGKHRSSYDVSDPRDVDPLLGD